MYSVTHYYITDIANAVRELTKILAGATEAHTLEGNDVFCKICL